MVKLLFLFPKGGDQAQMDAYAANTVIPGLKSQPGFRSITGSAGPLMGGRDLPYSRVIEVSFETLGDVMAARQSSRGEADVEHQRRFGVIALLYEVEEL
jgi:hypothetical protein